MGVWDGVRGFGGGVDWGGMGRRGRDCRKREMSSTVRAGKFPTRTVSRGTCELENSQLAPHMRCEVANSQLAPCFRARATWQIPSSHRRGPFRVFGTFVIRDRHPPFTPPALVPRRQSASMHVHAKRALHWNRTHVHRTWVRTWATHRSRFASKVCDLIIVRHGVVEECVEDEGAAVEECVCCHGGHPTSEEAENHAGRG